MNRLAAWVERWIAPHPGESGFTVWFQEEARAERITSVVRFSYLIIWLVVVVSACGVNSRTVNLINITGGVLWLTWAAAYHVRLTRRPYRARLKYFSLTVDTFFSMGIFFLYHLDALGAPTTLKSPVFCNAFLLLALAALRFDESLPVYGGLLTLGLYGTLIGYFAATGRIVWGDRVGMVTGNQIDPAFLIFNALYVVTFTIVLVVLVRQARRLVRLRSEETQRALVDKHERDRMLATLERYFTPQVARHLLENPGALGGRLQEATIVFADVRDFTRLSESLGPVKTMQFLNALFEKMVDIIFKHGGTLDKYMGDGMLVVFGVPQARPDDALRALRAAVEMSRAAESVGDWSGVTLGCAVHSGEVLMGNVGSSSRMEFTVIGDVVNTASRMEQLNKRFRTTILLSEATLSKVRDKVEARAMPATDLRGKSEHVPLHEFLGWKSGGGGAAS